MKVRVSSIVLSGGACVWADIEGGEQEYIMHALDI